MDYFAVATAWSGVLFRRMQKSLILFCRQHKLCYFCTVYTVNWGDCGCVCDGCKTAIGSIGFLNI